jgi:hypothetical protein
MTTKTLRVSGNLRSIQAMLAAVLMFSIMDTIMKLLSAEFPAMQVAALRSLSSLPLVCAYVAWRGGFRSIFQVRWPLHLLRAAIGIVMLALFAYGVRDLSAGRGLHDLLHRPDPDHGAVRVRAEGARQPRALDRDRGRHGRRAGGAAAQRRGLPDAGRPGDPGGGRVLRGVRGDRAGAGAQRQQRADGVLADADDGRRRHHAGAPAGLAVEARHLPLLGGLAVSGFLAQLALTEAFSHGEASVVAPFEYTALACGVAIDWIFWQTLPDQYTLIGAAIIIGSGLYLIRHETAHAEAEHP